MSAKQPAELEIKLFVEDGYPFPEHVKPSSNKRDWFAPAFYHCLPLTMANGLGWTIECPGDLNVYWAGGDSIEQVTVHCAGTWAVSHFGYGVFTVHPGFFVRTSPGVNTLVKGVPNIFKDGVTPLEGLMETDWMTSSFTLNFRITRPCTWIHYAKGEPLAQLLPFPRNYVEDFAASVVTGGQERAEFLRQERQWSQQRARNLAERMGNEARDHLYLRGRSITGDDFDEHQRRLRTPPFQVQSGE